MIEKLKIMPENEYVDRFPNVCEIMNKINEIIDKVNQLEKAYNTEHYVQLNGTIKNDKNTDKELVDFFCDLLKNSK